MQQLDGLQDKWLSAVAGAGALEQLEALRVEALGKKGEVTGLMKTLGGLSPEERKEAGQRLNQLKDALSAAIDAKKAALEGQALDQRLRTETIDLTLPARPESEGRLHPISQTIDEIIAIFGEMGFQVAEGPDIEDDFKNFTALNIPPDHPARQMQDTFYLPKKPDEKEAMVLRTHTSPVQIRTMLSQKPPIRVICPGRTYRSDSDMTHTPMFHQVEGLVIDEITHMGHLKGCLIDFVRAYFGIDDLPVRFRNSFFPFTEPSAEVDIGCDRSGGELKLGQGKDWLEILGSGMVHPKVLANCGIDPTKYQGFAFGMGIERIAMLKYGIPDLRTFFDADLRWLKHYGFVPLDVPSMTGGADAMKFTLSWLKQHLETDADLATISRTLTMIGLEVEGIEDRAKDLKPFTIGYVVEAVQHPNADKLRVCKVDTGKGIVQVVCGAPNARTGMKGVFAPPGSHIPGTGLDLKQGVIRGVESNGMLCSMREMGLGQDHDGIIDLAADAPVGQPFADYMGFGDPVLEIKLTPDRADCLGVHGVARDLAAAGLGRLKPFAPDRVEGRFTSPLQWQRRDDAALACPYVVGRYFRNVKNGPSPKWLQERLTAIGLRPISALVDITNFVTFDLGRPLHVFDADKVKGNPTMRMARAGEKVLALDGFEYEMEPGMVVIADDERVEAIGGIMGGEYSGVSATTTNVFLEVALFDAVTTARTGRKLGINSDARYRFERGVDPESAEWGVDVATKLILELCGGEASQISRAGKMPEWHRKLPYRPARALGLGGVDVASEKQHEILSVLGFGVEETESDKWRVTPPSWRADVEGEADLVEEVIRINDYDNIPVVSLPKLTALPVPAVTPQQRRVPLAKRLLATRGLLEAVTFSFMPSAIAKLFQPKGSNAALVMLANPISADLDAMRPSILGNLLTAAARNAARGYADVGLFEVGPTYLDETEKGQILSAAGVRVGLAKPRNWEGKPRSVDAFDAKADALALLQMFGVPVDNLQIVAEAPGYYHPGRSAVLRLGPTILAQFGELHPNVIKACDIKGAAVGFEVYLERLPMPRAKGSARPLLNAPPFQPLERDFAFLVDATVPADKLTKAAKSADKALITDARVFDLFQGGSLPEGKKSIAFSVTIQPRERTLTDQEIEALSAKVVAAVNKATGGELRK